ncbi:hypothetical protein FACS1894204_10870 [Synergistales bacterium]|nr:hypothetical protein FACS1894204_10870 [Synergistales bacterium]
MKRKFFSIALVLALCFVLAGSARADVDSVKQAIEAYGLIADVSGNKITVTGTVAKQFDQGLELLDISGLVIDWRANLTVTGDLGTDDPDFVPEEGTLIHHFIPCMIGFSNGTFIMSDGKIQISVSGDGETNAIQAGGSAAVTLAGGELKGDRAEDIGINMERASSGASVTIESGKIDVPRGQAILASETTKITITASDPNAVINGMIVGFDGADATATAYGHAIAVDTHNVFNFDGEDDEFPEITYKVNNGATWDIDGITSDMTVIPNVDIVTMKVGSGGTLNFKNTNMKFKGKFDVEESGVLNVGVALGDTSVLTNVDGTAANHGTINIYGTLTNLDKLINDGTINNYSANTLDNQGTLTNNGIINNKSTGKIKNTGTISNEGTISNDGTINNDGHIYSDTEIGGTIDGNPVESLPDEQQDEPHNSGGGGCNAGFGLFGLLPLAVWVARKRI